MTIILGTRRDFLPWCSWLESVLIHWDRSRACICKTDPPKKINLEMVAEYCFFTTMSLKDMAPSHKRNLLYWWYMTNHYFICGRGVTKEPPECLKAAIRLAYLEEDGKYTGYKLGKNSKSK
jgi:hypothetical protein